MQPALSTLHSKGKPPRQAAGAELAARESTQGSEEHEAERCHACSGHGSDASPRAMPAPALSTPTHAQTPIRKHRFAEIAILTVINLRRHETPTTKCLV